MISENWLSAEDTVTDAAERADRARARAGELNGVGAFEALADFRSTRAPAQGVLTVRLRTVATTHPGGTPIIQPPWAR